MTPIENCWLEFPCRVDVGRLNFVRTRGRCAIPVDGYCLQRAQVLELFRELFGEPETFVVLSEGDVRPDVLGFGAAGVRGAGREVLSGPFVVVGHGFVCGFRRCSPWCFGVLLAGYFPPGRDGTHGCWEVFSLLVFLAQFVDPVGGVIPCQWRDELIQAGADFVL